MNKVVKLLVVSVLAVLLVCTLVACSQTTTQDLSKPLPDGVFGGGGSSSDNTGDGGSGDTPDVDLGDPEYLTFSYLTQAPSVFSHIYVDEFKLSNVLYHVNYVNDDGVTTVGEGQPLTEDMLDSASKKAITVAGSHSIYASKIVDGSKVSGSFFLHLMNRNETKFVNLTFNLDGGTATFGTVADGKATTKVQEGATYTWSELIASFPVSKAGYALDGWKQGSTTYDSSSDSITFNSDATLTAQWTNAYVEITFDINAPEGATWTPATDNSLPAGAESGIWKANAVKNDGVVARPNANDINTLGGYAFVGWNTKQDLSGEVWNFNSKVGGENFTLYAMWAVREYSVTYYLMGGEFKDASIAIDGKSQLKTEVTYAKGYHEGDEEYDPNYTQNFLTDKPIKIVFEGLEYGSTLGDFYSTFSMTNGSKKKITASADADTLKGQLVKGLIENESSYYIEGWYTSQAFRDDELYTGGAISSDLVLYAKWSLRNELSDAHKAKYFSEYLYSYTVKGDGTVRIDLVRDSSVSELIVPNEINGHIVSEIGANAGMNLLSLGKIDASATTGLTTIGASAFASCVNMREIVHPDSSKIEEIGKDAFVSTEWLNTYAERKGTEYVSLGTVLIGYVGDPAITAIDLSSSEFDGLTVIAPYAFQGLANLESIVIGDSFKTIGEYAFNRSNKLASVSGGSNLEYIASTAFENTDFINNAPIDDASTTDVDESTYLRIGSVFYRFLAVTATKAVVPSGIKVIAPNAFYNANNVVEIKFLDASQIEKVDATAFTSTKWIRSEISTASTGHAGTFIKNGFVVINHTLVNYTGHDTIISLPAEVKKIASKAFVSSSAKITNVIIPADSTLELVETEGFAGLDYLTAVSFLNTAVSFPVVESNAFSADGEIVGNDLKFYFYKAPYDQLKTASGSAVAVTDGDSDALKSWKSVAAADINRIQRLATQSATFATNVPTKYLRGTSAIDFTSVWADAGILTADNLYIVNGAVVRRSDGVLRTENLPVSSIVFGATAGDKGEHTLTFTIGGGVHADGSDYNVESAELAYEVFMAIDQSTIKFYHTDDNNTVVEGVPTFYTTQTSLPTKGLGILFKYVDGTDGSLPLNDDQITVEGYSAQRGSGKSLTVKVNYKQGLANYSSVFNYTVNEPKNKSIKPISALSLSVNSNATTKYKDTNLLVVMDDGRESIVNLNSVSIISRADAESKNVNATTLSGLDTTELGYHTAGVRYGDAAKGFVFSTFIYSVTLDTDANAFTYRIVSETNKTAVITGMKIAYSSQTTVAIPSKVRLTENGYYAADSAVVANDYTIVGIGDQAFKNNTSIEYVYIPSSVVSIGEEAFYGCTSLKQARSFDIKGELTSSSIGMSSVRVTEETINYVGNVTITGVVNTSNDVIIPLAFSETVYKDGEGTDNCDLVEKWTRNVLLADNALSAVTGKISLPDTEYFRTYAQANLADKHVEFYAKSTSVTVSVERFTYDNYDAPADLEANATGKVTIISNATVQTVDGLILVPAYIESNAGNISRVYIVAAFEESAFSNATDYEAFCLPNSIESYTGDLTKLFGTTSYYDVTTYVYNTTDDYIYAPANHFSSTVKTIGDRAFYGCISLGKVVRSGETVVEDNTIDFTESIALEEIGMNAFYGCTAIETLDLSKTAITEISVGTFYECTALVSVALSTAVEIIGSNAFSGCVELTTVSGMKNVTFVGAYAFYNCAKLTNAYIPTGVTASGVGIDAYSDTASATTVYVLSKAVAEGMAFSSHDNNAGGIISDRNVVYVIATATVTDTGFLGAYEVSGEATTITVDGESYSVVKYIKKA